MEPQKNSSNSLKVLLVSDTHGNLDAINRLVKHKQADLVIHAGDFGFYDSESIHRLSLKELRLRILHSPHRDKLIENAKKEDLIDLIQTYHLLGDFPNYLSGEKKFEVPIYAVWGNHDDHIVIESLRSGRAVQNLNLLDEQQHYTVTDKGQEIFQLYGLGGNFLINQKAFTSTFQGNGGKIQATLHQFGKLYKEIKQSSLPSVFVSHVSPGKEPLLSRLITHFAPNFWISGHMGSPFPCVWNQTTIRRWKDIENWMSDSIEVNAGLELSTETKLALDLINAPLENRHDWVRKTWNINLPDLHDGYALLSFNKNDCSLETCGRYEYT